MSQFSPQSTSQFSPSRLKIARQLAGLKQVELAELVDLSPPALSQYENGLHMPSPPIVQRLAFSLGCPIEFLFADAVSPVATRAFFRSLRSTPQKERDRAAAFAWLVANVVDLVEADIRLPRCDLRLEIGLHAPKRVEVEAAAALARETWAVPPGPVAHVIRLMEAHGAVVATFRDGDVRLSAFSQWHERRPIVIFCLGKDDKARQRYDAAHELAHLALHGDAEPGNHVLEQQAEEFASAFLMPAEEIVDFLPRGRVDWEQLQELKRVWGVSLQALLVRANRLGTLSDRALQNAYRFLSAQGWRRAEPGDLGRPELPALLPRAFALLERKGLNAEDIFRRLALPERYLFDIAGAEIADAAPAGALIRLVRDRPRRA